MLRFELIVVIRMYDGLCEGLKFSLIIFHCRRSLFLHNVFSPSEYAGYLIHNICVHIDALRLLTHFYKWCPTVHRIGTNLLDLES